MMHIAKNSVVSIRYIMKNSKGEVLENTMNSRSGKLPAWLKWYPSFATGTIGRAESRR